jgi:hypothetical protein
VIGKISPFNEPARTSNFTGLPKKIRIKVDTTIKPIINKFS